MNSDELRRTKAGRQKDKKTVKRKDKKRERRNDKKKKQKKMEWKKDKMIKVFFITLNIFSIFSTFQCFL